jgi:hypothetical protein
MSAGPLFFMEGFETGPFVRAAAWVYDCTGGNPLAEQVQL